jgi:hypothetical protein
MGLEYFVMVRPDSPGFSGALRYGKTLAAGGESLLRDVARQIGATPLASFFSTDPDLARLEMEEGVRERAISPEALRHEPDEERWFSPEEGLSAARALLSHVETAPHSGPPHAAAALAELVTVLDDAQRRGLRWHFELF